GGDDGAAAGLLSRASGSTGRVKIVDVCEFYSPTGGGVRRYINQKLEFAGKFGHELTVIAPGAETRMEEAHGGTIAWIKSPQLPHVLEPPAGVAHPGPHRPGSGGRLLTLARRLAGGALARQGGESVLHA